MTRELRYVFAFLWQCTAHVWGSACALTLYKFTMLVVNCLFILVLTIPIIILNNNCTGIRVHACVRGFGVVVVWWVEGGGTGSPTRIFWAGGKESDVLWGCCFVKNIFTLWHTCILCVDLHIATYMHYIWFQVLESASKVPLLRNWTHHRQMMQSTRTHLLSFVFIA